MKVKMKKTCKWYNCCPINFFVKKNMLDQKWIENYCLIGNKECVRYKLEEKNEPHPDNLLPNGEIKDNLKL